MTDEPLVGVLAVQGDVEAHGRALKAAGARWIPVRRADQLAEVEALVLPGGESTTMLKALRDESLWDPLEQAIRPDGRGLPTLATCAGLILCAREVRDPGQDSLGLLDVAVRRNAYGRQIDSFIEEDLTSEVLGAFEGVFIRAPAIEEVGPEVDVLARRPGGEPVLVQEGRILGATFHPEMSEAHPVQDHFLELVRGTAGLPEG